MFFAPVLLFSRRRYGDANVFRRTMTMIVAVCGDG